LQAFLKIVKMTKLAFHHMTKFHVRFGGMVLVVCVERKI